jgi:hypothetical protein
MEKNLVSMARDVEKLRAELTNAEKRQRLNPGGKNCIAKCKNFFSNIIFGSLLSIE